MNGKEKAMVLKRRTATRLAKLMEEAVTMAYLMEPGQKPTQQMLSAKAGRLGVLIPEFEAWVEQASKLRGTGFARDQSLKALPVVTGGEVQWQGKQPKEAKMAAVKKTTKSGSKKSKAKAKKSKTKKTTKKSGRGKAVVVYFNTDNLSVLEAARKYAKKQDESLASVVTEALRTWLKL